MRKNSIFISLNLIRFTSNSISQFPKFFSTQSLLFVPSQSPKFDPQFSPSRTTLKIPNSNPNPNPNFSENDFNTLRSILRNPNLSAGSGLEIALEQTGIEPETCLLQVIFDHLDSSPKLLFSLFKWAEKRPGFEPSAEIFNAMIKILAKSRHFDSAWMTLLDGMKRKDGKELVSIESFAILIRRYARVGMAFPAIRTFEFANGLDLIKCSNLEMNLFEVLLDALCKEGHVRVASEYVDKKMCLDLDWVPSIRVYNILLNGWFRARKLKQVERLWMQTRKQNVVPTAVTYGTLIEGYCRMRRVERALELLGEMREDGIEPNAIVYNPIVDALAEAGRFKEALGFLERFLVLESGPNLSTYNSLVKGFCKAGDLVGASKILKTMTSRGFMPTATTYNYFFRYFSKHGKIEESMSLYRKMIDLGYDPDRLTFHLLIKMLCERERLQMAVQVSKEMKRHGFDMDLATSTMLIHLLCKRNRLKEAFEEFENMIRRGIVPQYLTYQRLKNELGKQGMKEMVRKLDEMMASVPHSKKIPDTYKGDEDASRIRRRSIISRAQVMTNVLKTCRDPRELAKRRRSSESVVESANQLIEDIERRVSET